MEREALAVHAGGHQRQQYRGGPGKGHDVDPGLVRAAHQRCSRDRPPRGSPLPTSDRSPRPPAAAPATARHRACARRERGIFNCLQRPGMRDGFQEAARGLRVFGDEGAKPARHIERGRRNQGRRVVPAQGDRDQIKRARRGLSDNGHPFISEHRRQLRSAAVRSARWGRCYARCSTSTMPSPSILALPAQSYGRSSSR